MWYIYIYLMFIFFFFSSRRRHTRCALVTGVQTCALPIYLAEPWRQNSWFEAARSKFARPVGYPPLTDDLRRRLSEYYAYDVAELSKMLGRDMGCWLEAEPQEA